MLFYFHENDHNNHWLPQLEHYFIDRSTGVIALSDGIIRQATHEENDYPSGYLGVHVSKIFTNSVAELHNDFNYKKQGIHELFHEINKRIQDFNKQQGFDFEKDIKSEYWMGETLGIVAAIKEENNVKTLYYGYMDDCQISVLRGRDMQEQVAINNTLAKSFQHAQKVATEVTSKTFEQIWCNEYRNNDEITGDDGTPVGWGSFNGDPKAAKFWKTGELELQSGDIVRIFTNGMAPLMESSFKEELNEFLLKQVSNKGSKSQTELSQLIKEHIESSENPTLLSREKSIIQLIIE